MVLAGFFDFLISLTNKWVTMAMECLIFKTILLYFEIHKTYFQQDFAFFHHFVTISHYFSKPYRTYPNGKFNFVFNLWLNTLRCVVGHLDI